MAPGKFSFDYEVYDSSDALSPEDAGLLQDARDFTATAYAPYSRFHVAAVARLKNGQVVRGTNQENASYPVGTCAERALLGALGALFPDEPIEVMAITYRNMQGSSKAPASPCGMCRQSLHEYEKRTNQPIRLILAGTEGKVYVIPKASYLLPLGFSSEDLK